MQKKSKVNSKKEVSQKPFYLNIWFLLSVCVLLFMLFFVAITLYEKNNGVDTDFNKNKNEHDSDTQSNSDETVIDRLDINKQEAERLDGNLMQVKTIADSLKKELATDFATGFSESISTLLTDFNAFKQGPDRQSKKVLLDRIDSLKKEIKQNYKKIERSPEAQKKTAGFLTALERLRKEIEII